jgi:hypothetical protein
VETSYTNFLIIKMMTNFKSVSAQTPKLVGKNLAKVKGGGDAGDIHCARPE